MEKEFSTKISKQLIVYDIVLSRKIKNEYIAKLKTANETYSTDVLYFIKDTNIAINGLMLKAKSSSPLYAIKDKLQKELEKEPLYFLRALKNNFLFIKNISDLITYNSVIYLLENLLNMPDFTFNFTVESNLTTFFNNKEKDVLLFEDEHELERYIYFILNSINNKDHKLLSSSTHDNANNILERMLDKGFSKLGYTQTYINKEELEFLAISSNISSTFVDLISSIDYYFITLVLEKNNFRFFISYNPYLGRSFFSVSYYTHPMYKYIDIRRIFIPPGRYAYNQLSSIDTVTVFYDLPKNLKSYITQNKKIFSRKTVEVVLEKYNINNKSKSDKFKTVLATLDDLNNLIEDNKRIEELTKQNKQLEKTISKKIEYKLSKLKSDENFKFILNDVTYTKDYIKYGDQILKIHSYGSTNFPITKRIKNIGLYFINKLFSEYNRYKPTTSYYYYTEPERFEESFIKQFKTEKLNQIKIKSIYDITFDILYIEFIYYLYRYILNTTYLKYTNEVIQDLSMTIGSVNITINTTKVLQKGPSGDVYINYVYINDIKIRHSDVLESIYRALAFETTSDYNNFLQDVSYTSLIVTKYLKEGLILDFYDNILSKRIKLKLDLERIKNKNYIKLNNKLFQVKNTNKLLKISSFNQLSNIILTLTNNNIVDHLSYKELKGFITKGMEKYKSDLEKEEKLLNEVIKSLDIQIVNNVSLPNNISLDKAFYIKGSTRNYYMEYKEPFNIFSEKEGRYICMLDKTPFTSSTVKLISRLHALKNDALVSTHIQTLNF